MGAVPAITSPGWFISEQLSSAVPLVSSPNANLVAQQLGNGFGMAFMMAFAILYASTELNVIRNYLIALWVADIGHVGLTLYALGWDGSLDFANWNPMTWGNVAVTVSEMVPICIAWGQKANMNVDIFVLDSDDLSGWWVWT